MINVPIGDTSYSENTITLSAVRYTFTYRYNERVGRWFFDIYSDNDTLLYSGLKILEGTSPDIHLENVFTDGFLQTMKLEGDDLPAGRDNVGINKSYSLIYSTYQELLDS